MPADSEGRPAGAPVWPELPYTWRPLGPLIAGGVAIGGLIVVCVFSYLGFDAQTKAGFTLFQVLTLAAVALLFGAVAFGVVRSRVEVSREGLVVVNGYRVHRYTWAQIVGVRLPQGAPWVTLDLADGSSVSVLAIQSSDGDRAKRAARHLRMLATELTR